MSILVLCLFGALVCAIAYVAIEAARSLTDFGDDE
jgi:hypothetical protein